MRDWLIRVLGGQPEQESGPPPIRCMNIHRITDRKVTGELYCKYDEGHTGEHNNRAGVRWRD